LIGLERKGGVLKWGGGWERREGIGRERGRPWGDKEWGKKNLKVEHGWRGRKGVWGEKSY